MLRCLLGNVKMSISMKDTAEAWGECVRQHPGKHWVHTPGPHQQDKQRGWAELWARQVHYSRFLNKKSVKNVHIVRGRGSRFFSVVLIGCALAEMWFVLLIHLGDWNLRSLDPSLTLDSPPLCGVFFSSEYHNVQYSRWLRAVGEPFLPSIATRQCTERKARVGPECWN